MLHAEQIWENRHKVKRNKTKQCNWKVKWKHHQRSWAENKTIFIARNRTRANQKVKLEKKTKTTGCAVRSVVGLVIAKADENHDLRDRLNQFRADAEKFCADSLEFQKLVNNVQSATEAHPSAEASTSNGADFRPVTAKPKLTCSYCTQQHPMNKCLLYLKLSTKQRWNCVKELGLFQNCFAPTWHETRAPRRCRHQNCKCGKFHNTTLCSRSQSNWSRNTRGNYWINSKKQNRTKTSRMKTKLRVNGN